jgi:cyclase
VSACLNAGADKVSVNSSAINNPALIDQLSREFGNQCIVVAIDTRNVEGQNIVHSHGGTKPTTLDTIKWAKEMQERGAGELLLTSMDKDGTKSGFANELTAYISTHVSIPIIASGGAGTMEHFTEVFTLGKADAALAASIFHFKEISIPELKTFLSKNGIRMRN